MRKAKISAHRSSQQQGITYCKLNTPTYTQWWKCMLVNMNYWEIRISNLILSYTLPCIPQIITPDLLNFGTAEFGSFTGPVCDRFLKSIGKLVVFGRVATARTLSREMRFSLTLCCSKMPQVLHFIKCNENSDRRAAVCQWGIKDVRMMIVGDFVPS